MNASDDSWTAAVLDVGRRLTQLGIDAPVRSPCWPFYWRWGYGHPWPHGYRPEDPR